MPRSRQRSTQQCPAASSSDWDSRQHERILIDFAVPVTLDQYARHYNGRRPHRALQLQPPRSTRPVIDLTHERIKRRPVLGGVITEYERAA
jgi:hypothetical protein